MARGSPVQPLMPCVDNHQKWKDPALTKISPNTLYVHERPTVCVRAIRSATNIAGLRSRRHAGLCYSKWPKRILPTVKRLMNTATSNHGVSIVHMPFS